MILSANTLRRLKPVEPFIERTVIAGMSAGLSVAGYDVRVREKVTLKPGDFSLASTIEKFDIPKNIMAWVKDKSSWARRGLSVLNTVIEPGWRGVLTLELKNLGQEILTIESGSPIAQVVFALIDEATEGYASKYQDQEAGPQKFRHEQTP